MKKIWIMGMLCSLLLAGCGKSTKENKEEVNRTKSVESTKKVEHTENVENTESVESTEEAVSTEKVEDTEKKENSSIQQTESNSQSEYFYLEACEELIDLQLDILEEAYEQGKISREDYRNQEKELEQKENQYELERKALGYHKKLFESTAIQDSDKKVMKKRLIEVKEEEEKLERQVEILEQTFMDGSISKEDFILKRSKQLEEEEKLDQEEEWLEKKLGR